MEQIKDKDKVLVIIIRENDWSKGLKFFTPDSAFLQTGTWFYDKGTKLASHVHKENERITSKTQEFTYIKEGKMKAIIYDSNKNYLTETILSKGDFAIFLDGGHGYEILEDNTKVIEVKNGPFISVEKDKEKF